MGVAQELQKAWNDASKESGFHDPGNLTIAKAEMARDKFYQVFWAKTGLHDSLVRGLFADWCRLSHDQVMALGAKHEVEGFCAYLADYIERRTASAGMSTASHFDGTEQELHGEIH
jgi:hypothetical protein